MDKLKRIEKREIATAYVRDVESKTFCAHCGNQPVEWHKPSHVNQPNARVSSLRTQGVSVERIQKEMDSCIPLCRICHMKEDGRLDSLRASQPNQKGIATVPPMPCECCGKKAKPLRKGKCTGCYNHHTGLRPRKRMTCDGCCRLAQ